MAHRFNKKWRSDDVKLLEKADFSVMLLSDPVIRGLKKAGFITPSPIQLEAIPIGRFGKDLLVQAKSGTGKTLVFTVIALESFKPKLFRPQVLIVAPTREIATQICSVIHCVGASFPKLTCCSFIGGLPLVEDKERGSTCQIAVGTPGRLRQLIKLGSLPTNSIRLLVFDEADQLFQGTFKPEMDDIFKCLPEDKQVIATSATYPSALRKVILKYMRDPFIACINTNELALLGIVHYVGIVEGSLMPLLEYKNKLVLLEKVLTSIKFCQCLVFCNMVSRVEVLCRDIKSLGFATTYISSAKQQVERLKVLDRLKHFKCKVLVSSDVTSRGIDAENVDLVINFDLAHSTETYLHRVGRAGRYGSVGLAVSIITQKEVTYLDNIEAGGHFKSYKLPDPLPQDLIRNPYLGEYTIKEKVSDSETDESSYSDDSCLGHVDDNKLKLSNGNVPNEKSAETKSNEENSLERDVLNGTTLDSSENGIIHGNYEESLDSCSESNIKKVAFPDENESKTFSENHNDIVVVKESQKNASDIAANFIVNGTSDIASDVIASDVIVNGTSDIAADAIVNGTSDIAADAIVNGTASLCNDTNIYNGVTNVEGDMSADLLNKGDNEIIDKLDSINFISEHYEYEANLSRENELNNEQKNSCVHSSKENLVDVDEALQKVASECDNVLSDFVKVNEAIEILNDEMLTTLIDFPVKEDGYSNLINDVSVKKDPEIKMSEVEISIQNYLQKNELATKSDENNLKDSDQLCEKNGFLTEVGEILSNIQSEKRKLFCQIFNKFNENSETPATDKHANEKKSPTKITSSEVEPSNSEIIGLKTDSTVPDVHDEKILNAGTTSTKFNKRRRRGKKHPKKRLSDLFSAEDSKEESLHPLGSPKLQSTPDMSTNSFCNKMILHDSLDDCFDSKSDYIPSNFKEDSVSKSSNYSLGSSVSSSQHASECSNSASEELNSDDDKSEYSCPDEFDSSLCSESEQVVYTHKSSKQDASVVQPHSSYQHHSTNEKIYKNYDHVKNSRRMKQSNLKNPQELPSGHEIYSPRRNSSQRCHTKKSKPNESHSSRENNVDSNHGHYYLQSNACNTGRMNHGIHPAQSAKRNVPLSHGCHARCHFHSHQHLLNAACSCGISHFGCNGSSPLTAVQSYDIYYEQWKFIQNCVNSAL